MIIIDQNTQEGLSTKRCRKFYPALSIHSVPSAGDIDTSETWFQPQEMQPPNENAEPRDDEERSECLSAVRTKDHCGSYETHAIYGAKAGKGFTERVSLMDVDGSEHCGVQGKTSETI